MPLIRCNYCDWFEVVIFQEHMNKAMSEGMKKLKVHEATHPKDEQPAKRD